MPKITKRLSRTELTPLHRAVKSLSLPADFKPKTNITGILKRVPGGYRKAYDYLRSSSDKNAIRIMDAYDALSGAERKAVNLDFLIAALKISPKDTLELVVGEMYAQNVAVSSMIAAIEHPAIMKATIKSAKLLGAEGHQDRKMLHQQAGTAPVPKTQITRNNLQIAVSATASAGGLPSHADVVRTIDADDLEDFPRLESGT